MHNVAIHLGLHKTATTTLQHQLFPQCEDIELFITHRPELRSFIDLCARKDPLYFDPEQARSLLLPKFRTDALNLISNESLSGPPYAGLIEFGLDHRKPVIQNLCKALPQAKAFIVLRRQDKLAKSLYRQYLKAGGTRRVQRFYGFDERPEPGLMSLDRFYFKPYLDFLRAEFTDGLLVLTFEDFVRDSKSFLAKLADFLGVQFPEIELKRENATTLGPFGLELSRLLNHGFRNLCNPGGMLPGPTVDQFGKQQSKSPVELFFDWYPGKGKKGDSKVDYIYLDILDRVKEDNRKHDKEYDLGLAEHGYY